MQPYTFFIIALLLPAISIGQVKLDTRYNTSSNGGLCSSSIIFYSDSSYFKEHGCEAGSHVSAGKWYTHKDTIFFLPYNNKTLTIFISITGIKIPGDSVYVSILDKNDSNITGLIKLGMWVPGVGMYPFNNNGTKQTAYNRPNSTLSLQTLSKIFKRSFEFETASYNSFRFKLKIGPEYFAYPGSEWENDYEFKLLLKSEKLVGINNDPNFPVIYEQSN